MIKKKEEISKTKRMIATISVFILIVAIIILIIWLFIRNGSTFDNEKINENFTFLVDEESVRIENVDLFQTQNELTKKILDTYTDGNYTLDNPYLVVNPYLISPQSALVLFKTEKKEKITLTLKGKNNDDLITVFEASKEHFIPVYGLYGDYVNKIIIESESGKRKEIEIALDKTLNTSNIKVIDNKISNSNGEFYFATSALGTASIAYDNYGEVRWFLSADYSKGITMLQNGNMLLADVTPGLDVLSTGGVIEVDMLGFIHKEYEISGGVYNDAYELLNSNLLLVTSNEFDATVADVVVELDRNTGKILKTWDLKKIISSVDSNLIEYGEVNWANINSVFYDQKNSELVLSLRNRNSVVSIGYDDSKVKWILGDSRYWSSNFNDYLIRGIGENFVYPSGQHSIFITDEGRLSLFNNGYDAYKEKVVSCSSLQYSSSYAMLYNIDRENRTAIVIYRFGGQEYFSYDLSSYTYSLNNHKVFNSGWHFSNDSIFYDSSCTQYNNYLYDSYIIDFDENNNQVVKLNVDESKFEVIKAPIYNLAAVSVKNKIVEVISNYLFDEKASFYTSNEEQKYETLSEDDALVYENYEVNSIAFSMRNKRLSFEGSVPEEMTLMVTLISPSGTAYRFNLKESYKDLKETIDLSSTPSGRYYIYVDLNGIIYNTKQFIEI